VIAREQLLTLYFAGLRIPLRDDLGVVLDNVGKTSRGEDLLPQVISREPMRVRRVTGAVVPALVERQKPRGLACQMRAEPNLMVIDRKMRHPAAELEQFLARIAVAFVLLDRILDGLLRQAVLQLESCDRQAVHEQSEIERVFARLAVAQLPGHRKSVLPEALRRFRIPGRRRPVEQGHFEGSMPKAPAQHVDDAALADLALQPGEKLLPDRRVDVEIESRNERRLVAARNVRNCTRSAAQPRS
jgi:hypothetical protein